MHFSAGEESMIIHALLRELRYTKDRLDKAESELDVARGIQYCLIGDDYQDRCKKAYLSLGDMHESELEPETKAAVAEYLKREAESD